MSRKRVLYLFDVDGTLTKPRQKITEELKLFLIEKVKPLVSIGLVSGSDYSKIVEQIDGEKIASQFDFLFCENGLVHYSNNKLISKQDILSHVGENKLQKLINFALEYMSKIELPAKRGNFIEFRSGMINICPVGRSCNQKERNEFSLYDQKHEIRLKFVNALKDKFYDSNITFALGGEISIDVFPTGWDKTYCLNHLEKQFEEIHFFGDKTDPGGNDFELYNDSAIIGHKVSSPEDTMEQLIKSLNIL